MRYATILNDKHLTNIFIQCFEMNGSFWQKEAADIKQYLEEQVGEDCPAEIYQQCDNLAARAKSS